MKNKPTYFLPLMSLISTSLFLQTSGSAAPLVSIGDNADIFFNGSSGLQWTSNVFRTEGNEVDDLTWTLSPGFEMNVGRGVSNADFSVITSYDIIRYNDESQLDTELFHIKAVGTYQASRLDLNGSVAFDEHKTSSGDTNVVDDLVEFDTFSALITGEYQISPKTSFGAGVRYSEKEYQTFDERFADRETISFPLDAYYELTPKVDLSLGYVYSETDVEATAFNPFNPNEAYTTESHFINLGARGALRPKLSGFFKIGYRTRDDDRNNAEDSGMLGLDADLTWTATPKMTVRLGLSRDFGTGGEGQSTENSSVDLSGSYSINSQFAASANVGYTLRDYSNIDREDDQLRGGFRFSYMPNQYWNFSTGYTYSENDSNQDNRSYENHTVDLTASLRY